MSIDPEAASLVPRRRLVFQAHPDRRTSNSAHGNEVAQRPDLDDAFGRRLPAESIAGYSLA
jgi:hypothetical protein